MSAELDRRGPGAPGPRTGAAGGVRPRHELPAVGCAAGRYSDT